MDSPEIAVPCGSSKNIKLDADGLRPGAPAAVGVVILVSDDGDPIGVAMTAVVVGGSALVAAVDFAGAYLVDLGLAVGNFGSVAVLSGVSDRNESERSSDGDECDKKCFHEIVSVIF